MIRTLNRRVVIVAVVVLVAVIAGGCRSSTSTPTQESPLSPTVPSPVIPTRPPKIDPELMLVIEKGREAAPDDFWFNPEGRISCIVFFDRDKIVVTPTSIQGLPMGEQPAGKLVIHHGGQVTSELAGSNSVGCFIPLDKIKGLAREEAVISIIPNRIVEPID